MTSEPLYTETDQYIFSYKNGNESLLATDLAVYDSFENMCTSTNGMKIYDLEKDHTYYIPIESYSEDSLNAIEKTLVISKYTDEEPAEEEE